MIPEIMARKGILRFDRYPYENAPELFVGHLSNVVIRSIDWGDSVVRVKGWSPLFDKCGEGEEIPIYQSNEFGWIMPLGGSYWRRPDAEPAKAPATVGEVLNDFLAMTNPRPDTPSPVTHSGHFEYKGWTLMHVGGQEYTAVRGRSGSRVSCIRARTSLADDDAQGYRRLRHRIDKIERQENFRELLMDDDAWGGGPALAVNAADGLQASIAYVNQLTEKKLDHRVGYVVVYEPSTLSRRVDEVLYYSGMRPAPVGVPCDKICAEWSYKLTRAIEWAELDHDLNKLARDVGGRVAERIIIDSPDSGEKLASLQLLPS